MWYICGNTYWPSAYHGVNWRLHWEQSSGIHRGEISWNSTYYIKFRWQPTSDTMTRSVGVPTAQHAHSKRMQHYFMYLPTITRDQKYIRLSGSRDLSIQIVQNFDELPLREWKLVITNGVRFNNKLLYKIFINKRPGNKSRFPTLPLDTVTSLIVPTGWFGSEMLSTNEIRWNSSALY